MMVRYDNEMEGRIKQSQRINESYLFFLDQIKRDVEQYTNDIETLAERMTDAYRDDKDAIANGTLAINKLQLLNDVVAMLHRYRLPHTHTHTPTPPHFS